MVIKLLLISWALNGETSPIPEPTTMLLFGTGLVGVAGAARRKKKKQAYCFLQKMIRKGTRYRNFLGS